MRGRTTIGLLAWTALAAAPVPLGCRRAEPEALRASAPRTAAEWCASGDRARSERKDLRGAEEAYRCAIELEPGMAPAHFALGLVLLDLRSPVEAAAALESALALAPADAAWRKDAEDALARAHLLR